MLRPLGRYMAAAFKAPSQSAVSNKKQLQLTSFDSLSILRLVKSTHNVVMALLPQAGDLMRCGERRTGGEADMNLAYFQHEPLNLTKASVRLLRILPTLSSTGLIQCQIWHDQIDASYTCLSYVWGSEADGNTILINDAHFSIRKNLFTFLEVARTKYGESQRTFWIDA